ncbi:hypothetical protein QUB60_00700 [Microcoleus sp. A2-C5]
MGEKPGFYEILRLVSRNMGINRVSEVSLHTETDLIKSLAF